METPMNPPLPRLLKAANANDIDGMVSLVALGCTYISRGPAGLEVYGRDAIRTVLDSLMV